VRDRVAHYLFTQEAARGPYIEAILQGFRKLGYLKGRTW
jgi:hypothetical protein